MGRLLACIVVVLLVVSELVVVSGVAATGVGYLAIKDYLGKVWTIDDVQKIINYHYETADGKIVSLADYFWIVVDNDYKNKKHSLRDFIASPLDNKTAVLPLSPGDHIVDIYWYGYHQRQLVHVVSGQTYVLDLRTAPVVPFKTAGEPPGGAEWGPVYNPKGLTLTRRDGKAWVRFDYGQPIIDVAWYDDSTGWNYQSLTVNIDTKYQYTFHIKDPNHPEYYEEKTGSFLWLKWDVYKVKEEVKWNRTGQILHVSYIVAIAENDKLLSAANKVWRDVGYGLVSNALKQNMIDRVTYTIDRMKAFVDYLQTAYDTYMAEFFAANYQKTVILIWDVFATPTQIIITATAYDVENGKPEIKPITSDTAFIINNRLVYIKQLAGGIEYYGIDTGSVTLSSGSCGVTKHVYVKNSNTFNIGQLAFPGGDYLVYHLDDMSKYSIRLWFQIPSITWTRNDGTCDAVLSIDFTVKAVLAFDDAGKADIFEKQLQVNDISYERDKNSFSFIIGRFNYGYHWGQGATRITLKTSDEIMIADLNSITKFIPLNSSGTIKLVWSGNIGIYFPIAPAVHTIKFDNAKILIMIVPKMIPPQISLLKDGFQRVNGAFAVQVYSTLFRDEASGYLLGYYLLGNEPPPSFVIRDVHPDYDMDKVVVDYVWTIITADAYGQDIVDMKANTTLDSKNETIYNYYLSIKPTVRTFDNVTLALFDLNRMAFLNLAPDMIEYLLAVPPNQGGYGVPIIDWSKVSVAMVNSTRPYVLYYYDRQDGGWVRVKTVYHNDTRAYDIVMYADNTLVEKLPPGNISRYYYRLVYSDTNETLKGWLWNDNGTLKIITGGITWSLTPQELDKILEQIQLQGVLDKWAEQWNAIAAKLGLLAGMAGQVNGLLDWFSRNKLLILGGFLGFIVLLMLVAAAARPRIVVSTGIRR